MNDRAESDLIYREDVRLWSMFTMGDLRKLINGLEIPDDYELMPNLAGNLLVFRPEPDPTTRRYVGYIDPLLGKAVTAPDITTATDYHKTGTPNRRTPVSGVSTRAQRPDGTTYQPICRWTEDYAGRICLDPRDLNSIGPDDV